MIEKSFSHTLIQKQKTLCNRMPVKSLSREEEKDHLSSSYQRFTGNFDSTALHLFSILTPLLPESLLLRDPVFYPLINEQTPTRCNSALLQVTEHLQDPLQALHAIHAYEYWQQKSNEHGVVFTPRLAAEALIERGLSQERTSGDICTILDPACGTGILLCSVLSRVLHRERIMTARDAAHFIEHSIFGVDRDPVAVSLCRFALLLTLFQLIPYEKDEHVKYFATWYRNIRCGDFLTSRSNDTFRRLDSLHWGNGCLPEQFTHIIANPPYGLSRDGQIRSELLTVYKQEYKYVLSGKPNKYLLFFAAALRRLRDDGRLAFLIPNSWLGIRSARSFRERVLRLGHLTSIDTFKERIFPERGVEAVMVTAQRQHSASFVTRTFRSIHASTPTTEATLFCKEVLEQDSEARIPTGLSSDLLLLQKRFLANTTPLKDSTLSVSPKIALQVYATGKGEPPQTREIIQSHPFHHSKAISSHSKKYLSGRAVSRFSILWENEWLEYGPWVAEHQPIERFQGPRVLVREILGRSPYYCIATYTEAEYLYNRSILHIIPSRGCIQPRQTLLALLLLLNSKTGSFYLRVCGRKSSRALFPKIVLEDLVSFPIPAGFGQSTDFLSQEAERLLHNKISTIPDTIETEIAALYDLTLSEIEDALLATG